MSDWTIRRVPSDFSWPLGKTWHGYTNPWPGPTPCMTCMGIGLNEPCRKLHHTFRSWAPKLTRDEAAYLVENGVTPKEVAKLQERHPESDNPVVRSLLVEARANRKGFWGLCEDCNGEGEVPNTNPAVVHLYEKVNLYETWEPVHPPVGTAWQLWRIDDGNPGPVSPVFQSPEELARFCSKKFKGQMSLKKWMEWILQDGELDVQPVRPIFSASLDFDLDEPKKNPYILN